MTFRETVGLFEKAGIENPEFDARELWKKFSGIPVYDMQNANCNDEKLLSAIKRRESREPLQYILGEVGFFREDYFVTKDVLIPRSDTEILVEYATKHIPSGETFADFCTGSGCIAISTVKNTNSTHALAFDISNSALSIAKRNAEINGVSNRVEFYESDLLKETPNFRNKIFAILSNPPYVTKSEYAHLEKELYCEPKIALVGDDDGLIFYKTFAKIGKDLIKDEGFLAFEIGYLQGDALKRIAEDCDMSCEIIKDYSSNDRVAILKKK